MLEDRDGTNVMVCMFSSKQHFCPCGESFPDAPAQQEHINEPVSSSAGVVICVCHLGSGLTECWVIRPGFHHRSFGRSVPDASLWVIFHRHACTHWEHQLRGEKEEDKRGDREGEGGINGGRACCPRAHTVKRNTHPSCCRSPAEANMLRHCHLVATDRV